MSPSEFPKTFAASSADAGKRLDQFLAAHLPETSRARVQQLIAEQQVTVNDTAAKASARLHAGDRISVLGEVKLPPLRAMAEEIPLDIVYEDDDLAVINKPSGMMVHAGAGATEAERNRGTLVNALLHRFGKLSDVGGELRPGIVHRLDKATSGLIIVAKNDEAHRRLSAAFAARKVKKTYIALVHGWIEKEKGTVSSSISRDPVRRTRMTTRGAGREAITHYKVQRLLASRFGKFSLLEVQIDTGRTHQIRVHLSSLRHPVVGDTLYGAPREIREMQGRGQQASIALPRNFLHAAALRFEHPRSGGALSFAAPLPSELEDFLRQVTRD
ncbi:MAG: RluA family pseudouridine synthase [Acidobacteriota bacterium]|nr:RluA family pseudouridine synthase [Acidobacteriota bacterium]